MTPREIGVPKLSLVVLIGVSGSGKSTFARRHFGPFEVLSSDFCRGLVGDDEENQAATGAAFEVLNFIAGKRLDAGRLTVVDATNVQPAARAALVELARSHDVLPVAIVLDLPVAECVRRNAQRTDRAITEGAIRRQHDQLRRSSRLLAKEGFRVVHRLTADDVDGVTIVRERLLNDFTHEHGPFDVIGDVHGCRCELEALLDRLGYVLTRDDQERPVDAVHPAGRKVVFVGDLVDRGPDSPGVLRLAMGMVGRGHALAVPGNHENKLVRALRGNKVTIGHGLAETLAQLAAEPAEFRQQVETFCYDLVSHLVLDDGNLVVAHAGLKQAYHGRASARVRSFALYGDTTGETDEFGLPVRLPWAADYRGKAMVLYGHTAIPEPVWVNNTLCLDTGCVFGGKLSALRYPEKEVVSVPAQRIWWEPVRPLVPVTAEPVRDPEVLDLEDVIGKRVVDTEHLGRVTVAAENAAGALEVMSRFAIDPRWLGYLPPTMAPSSTASRADHLEYPTEAFDDYRRAGVTELICEEKHMGSRAVVLVCRDGDVARTRFGSPDDAIGAIYTRTGRAFFGPADTAELLGVVRQAAATAGVWSELDADWLLLDCELLPWSLKARELLRQQYATVGAAARVALPTALGALDRAVARGLDVTALQSRTGQRYANAISFTDAYRRYCWPTDGLSGVQLAPFQILASSAASYETRDHDWHLDLCDRLVAAAPAQLKNTAWIRVDASNVASVQAGTDWWEAVTGAGGEGMVVKPLANLSRGKHGLALPGIKVRGREYLRLIYGPDYLEVDNLGRLRDRNLGRKRSLALREYALGLESLARLVRAEPLWRVHEPVFAVLALESEPVDPRL